MDKERQTDWSERSDSEAGGIIQRPGQDEERSDGKMVMENSNVSSVMVDRTRVMMVRLGMERDWRILSPLPALDLPASPGLPDRRH